MGVREEAVAGGGQIGYKKGVGSVTDSGVEFFSVVVQVPQSSLLLFYCIKYLHETAE